MLNSETRALLRTPISFAKGGGFSLFALLTFYPCLLHTVVVRFSMVVVLDMCVKSGLNTAQDGGEHAYD